MIIAEITAGLGNQLFQYSFARNLSLLRKQPLKLDLNFFKDSRFSDVYRLDKFNIRAEIASPEEIRAFRRREFPGYLSGAIRRILGRKIYYHNKYHLDENEISADKVKSLNMENIYLSGYWAGEKNFAENADTIREELKPVKPLSGKSRRFLEKINAANSVSLHFRRNDYVGNTYFVNLSMEYYRNAISHIAERVKNPVFFLFSDDPQWVVNNFKTEFEFTIVDANDSKTDYEDMILMSNCKHNIMANSTFSWWGAWLNRNRGKIVLAPEKWFRDPRAQKKYENGNLLPASWIKIRND